MAIKTRFLILSDTHGENIPNIQHIPADIAIHCGDLTDESKIEEFKTTIKLLKSIDAPLKLVIAGNHDFTLDVPLFKNKIAENPDLQPEDVEKIYGGFGEIHQLFEDARSAGVVFLKEGIYHFELANGAKLKVYASPFTPSLSNWGFQYNPEEGHDFGIDKEIGVDIVVTHGPPHGIMDFTNSRQRVGCPQLFGAIAQARPKFHCFGHNHEGWGAKLVTWRKEVSEVPSHFADIDNEQSTVIQKLSNLSKSKFDTPETAEEKSKKRARLGREGYIKTSHCTGDQNHLQAGSQTLFVNAAIEGVTEDYPMQLPWLVDLEMPESF
ncbi:Metallo-dependent phosphatase [Daldinia caldariorum]|uniref:Metallo-dependent phosphatase n=1 Tax=Daldinia caldariorum TaxID=326644 RepID=UPI002007918A|nr:Metallo-dependent phosphatase [Daldinia caldariorum]KAI1468363.1 Metallo-dependent phosphatase [Daldinia caldariorum]